MSNRSQSKNGVEREYANIRAAIDQRTLGSIARCRLIDVVETVAQLVEHGRAFAEDRVDFSSVVGGLGSGGRLFPRARRVCRAGLFLEKAENAAGAILGAAALNRRQMPLRIEVDQQGLTPRRDCRGQVKDGRCLADPAFLVEDCDAHRFIVT